jgi:integrase
MEATAQDHPQIEKRLVPRQATLATFVFAGLRIGELLDLRWRDVDLATGRLRIKDSKTDAGSRDVRLLPVC